MCKCANVQMCKSIFQNSQQNNLYYILYYNIIYNINNNLKVTLQNANRICTFALLHICTKFQINYDLFYHFSQNLPLFPKYCLSLHVELKTIIYGPIRIYQHHQSEVPGRQCH